ncbi:MAG TPA: hypothetical protein VIH50_07350 [Steroidobacteraceae bacterium]
MSDSDAHSPHVGVAPSAGADERLPVVIRLASAPREFSLMTRVHAVSEFAIWREAPSSPTAQRLASFSCLS